VVDATGPVIDEPLEPFSILRHLLVVPGSLRASLDQSSAAGVTIRSRPLSGGEWASVPEQFPRLRLGHTVGTGGCVGGRADQRRPARNQRARTVWLLSSSQYRAHTLSSEDLPPNRPRRVVVVGSGTRFLSGISIYTVPLANALADCHRVALVTMRRLLPSMLYPVASA